MTAVKYILVIFSIGLFVANAFDLITADQGLYGAVGVVILFGILYYCAGNKLEPSQRINIDQIR